jgi:thiol-disulfide isomerase/thioredoxin
MKKNIISLSLIFAAFSATAQSRVTLVEQFTNSSCPPCATYSPLVYNYANTNPTQLAVVAFHTSFPYNNDSMNIANVAESAARVGFYGIGGAPSSVFEGNVFNGSTGIFGPSITTYVTNRLLIAPQYDVASPFLKIDNNMLSGKFIFKSLIATNTTDSLVAHIIVIEKNVLKSSYTASPGGNSETSYGYVMRKMLPSASGTILKNKILNGSDTIGFTWNLANIKDTAQIRVVAFVQNLTTKAVYQAQIFATHAEPIVVVPTVNKNLSNNTITAIFPNPNNGLFEINATETILNVRIVNAIGATIFNSAFESSKVFIKDLNIKDGVYNVITTTEKGLQHKLITIAH